MKSNWYTIKYNSFNNIDPKSKEDATKHGFRHIFGSDGFDICRHPSDLFMFETFTFDYKSPITTSWGMSCNEIVFIAL